MLIRAITIRNVQGIRTLKWRPPKHQLEGWHVILGDNASGKSSFLRATSVALLGPTDAVAARQDWNVWVRKGSPRAAISVQVLPSTFDIPEPNTVEHREKFYTAAVVINPTTKSEVASIKPRRDESCPMWRSPKGWFSASYGPFRRFAGSDKDVHSLVSSSPRLGAHISLLGENAALPEGPAWLQQLKLESYEDQSVARPFVDIITEFINQDDFLPNGVKLKNITSKGVEFSDSSGASILAQNLSDGYRSLLSMTFELLRQLARVFTPAQLFDPTGTKVIAPGVVMIDEVDAHLHPTWQKKIGFWFVEHFPNAQFIVTTHSPLVCQAAIHGSIFRLPAPGTEEVSGRMLQGAELERLVFGNVLEAYSTEAFGTSETRSQTASQKLDRLAELNVAELSRALSQQELSEQQELRTIFGGSPHTLRRADSDQ